MIRRTSIARVKADWKHSEIDGAVENKRIVVRSFGAPGSGELFVDAGNEEGSNVVKQ